MARPRKFTPAKAARLAAEHAKGRTITSLADREGVAWMTVHFAINEPARKRWLKANRAKNRAAVARWRRKQSRKHSR